MVVILNRGCYRGYGHYLQFCIEFVLVPTWYVSYLVNDCYCYNLLLFQIVMADAKTTQIIVITVKSDKQHVK